MAAQRTSHDPLVQALAAGDIDLAFAHLKRCPSSAINARAGSNGFTPLHALVQHHPVPIESVRWLLSRGADPNALDNNKGTALHRAIDSGSPELIALLLEHGADHRLTDRANTHAFAALAHASTDLLRTVLERAAPSAAACADALCVAAAEGRPEALALLIEHSHEIDPRPRAFVGMTPLLLAIERGHAECARLLLAAGANPNLSCNQSTAIAWAAAKGHTDCVRLLLDHGVHPDATTPASQVSALQRAAGAGHADILEALLAAGANINLAESRFQRTALHYGVAHQRLEACRVLLAHGADLHRYSETLGTPVTQAHDQATRHPGPASESVLELLVSAERARRLAPRGGSPLPKMPPPSGPSL